MPADFEDEDDDIETTGNPKLKFRLPREDKFPFVPFDDQPPLMEQAQAILGDRMLETRMGYKLDGKVCNLRAILNAAGLKFKDE